MGNLIHIWGAQAGLLAWAYSSINLTGNVYIYSRPVDGGLGQRSHLFYASMVVVEITEHSLMQFWGYTPSAFL